TRASRVPPGVEVLGVDPEIFEADLALQQEVPARNEQALAADELRQQHDRPPACGAGYRKVLNLLARQHRRGEFRLYRLHLELEPGRTIDPHGATIERALLIHGVEANRERFPSIDALDTLEAVAIIRGQAE